MALDYDLVVNQGETYERLIPVKDGNGQPANVDGWQVAGQIRATHDSDEVLHTLSLTATGTNVRLVIPAATSSTWMFRLAKYDVELVAPNTTVTRLIEGSVVVKPEITRT